ncbi:MAG TPA: glycosyltransferase [Chitinophagaceae bacterium]|nr:glycosyltransferase [Chitinophagaceae bacterium]
MQPLVSVVMAAFNAGQYLRQSIESLLGQSFSNWELLVTNDGSTDDTESILQSYHDDRIKVFSQENTGVSAARNKGLEQMQGKYFTFLDADDTLPINSFEIRTNFAEQHPEVDIVSGAVLFFRNTKHEQIWHPEFRGDPFPLFIRNDKRVFCNPALFIRRKPSISYKFRVGMTHVEDLLFFTSIAQQIRHQYDYVEEIVYNYRLSDTSAMKNLEQLEKGYWTFYETVKNFPNVKLSEANYLKRRIIRIMFLSYLTAGKFGNAAKMGFKVIK